MSLVAAWENHSEETWKLSTDPQFADRVRNVAGFCMNPAENTLIPAVDRLAGSALGVAG